MSGTIFELILIFFLSIGFLLFTGKLLLDLIRVEANGFLRLFLNLTAGLLFCTVCYAIIKSGGKTILSLSILPLLFYFYKPKNSHKSSISFGSFTQDFFISIFCLLPFFAYFLFYYFDFRTGEFKSLFIDPYFYAEFSNSLLLWGAETKFYELSYYLPESRNMLVPYHYPELWFTALISEFSGKATVMVYAIITCSILCGLVCIGLMAALENQNSLPRWVIILLAYFIIMLSGIYLRIYDQTFIKDYYHWSESSLLSRAAPKLAFPTIFLLLTFLLIRQKKQKAALSVISLLPILSITFIPFTAAFILVDFFIHYLFKNIEYEKKYWQNMIPFALISIGFMIFYSVFKSSYTTNFAFNNSFTGRILQLKLNLTDIKIFSGNLLTRTSITVLFYFHLILLIGFGVKKHKRFIIPSFFGIISGIFTSCIFYPVMDSSQFGSCMMIVFTILAVFCIGDIAASGRNLRRGILISAIIISALFSSHIYISKRNEYANLFSEDITFLKKIAALIKSNPEPILVFMNDQDYLSMQFANWAVANPILNLQQYTNNSLIFSLGNPERFVELRPNIPPHDRFYANNTVGKSAWMKKYPIDNLNDFTTKNKIQYILCRRGAKIPASIYTNNHDSLVSPKSGDIFYSISE